MRHFGSYTSIFVKRSRNSLLSSSLAPCVIAIAGTATGVSVLPRWSTLDRGTMLLTNLRLSFFVLAFGKSSLRLGKKYLRPLELKDEV